MNVLSICRSGVTSLALIAAGYALYATAPAGAQTVQPSATLFENVRVFNGTSDKLSVPTNVLVVGNKIKAISSAAITPPTGLEVTRIAGGGRTLMPGLTDAHTHLYGAGATEAQVFSPNPDLAGLEKIELEQAEAMLMRGFTTIRDMAGPVYSAKDAIDQGKAAGPRIYPSGALICQTSGHCDFSTPPGALPRSLGGPITTAETIGFSNIVDGRAQVLAAVRYNLRNGASQIKIATSGGGASLDDPLYVDEFTFDEIKAAVEAADDFGTYVAAHSYTPKSVRRSIAAGVKVIEHGQLLDEATVKYIADKGIWLSTQVLDEAGPQFPQIVREKKHQIILGQTNVWRWAVKHNVKLAWGTDLIFDSANMHNQNSELVAMKQFMSPAHALRIATHDNAQLFALSGKRNPYPGKLGVVAEDAYADLLLVDGDPTVNLDIIADPEKNFRIIMKDGKIYKNSL